MAYAASVHPLTDRHGSKSVEAQADYDPCGMDRGVACACFKALAKSLKSLPAVLLTPTQFDLFEAADADICPEGGGII